MSTKFVSIVIPAYNERARIGATLQSVDRYLKMRPFESEVLVVDDGSTDGTPAFVQSLIAHMPNFKLLVNDQNKGKGFSVKRGMLEAEGEYRVFMDADNSVDISHLDSFLESMQEGTDVAIGSIKVGASRVSEGAGWYRRLLGRFANTLVQLFAVPGIQDTQRGFKVFTRMSAVQIFPRQTIDRFGFDIEVLVIARKYGFSIQELPVLWNNPAGSKVTFQSYVQTLAELMVITQNRILGRYSKDIKPASQKKLMPQN